MSYVLLLDGNHMLHRVAHIKQLQGLQSQDGRQSGMLYGFLRVLKATLDRFSASKCVVAWDSSLRSTRRREIFPGYKDRGPPSEERRVQVYNFNDAYIELSQEILPRMRIRQAAMPGREGDDVLWVLSRLLENDQVVVVSDDRDLLQLVSPWVTVYRPINDQIVTRENFVEMTGVTQRLFCLAKAICGDSSDGIPGIGGVAMGTVIKLFDGCDDYEDVFLKSVQSKETKQSKVAKSWKVISRNLDLVDLSREPYQPEELDRLRAGLHKQVPDIDEVNLCGLLVQWNFDSITNYFPQWIRPFRCLT